MCIQAYMCLYVNSCMLVCSWCTCVHMCVSFVCMCGFLLHEFVFVGFFLTSACWFLGLYACVLMNVYFVCLDELDVWS